MPIYEYECQACRHRFEYLLLSSSPAAECPSCHKKDLKQLISLCSMSSEGTREANFDSAHRKAAAVRKDKRQDEHKHLHEHFEDPAS